LHYHFAGKAELGEALLDRYTARFAVALEALDTDAPGAPAKLEGYANLYLDVLRDKRMCLCGMLAAEYQPLPRRMRDAVVREIARAIIGGLERAMLVARPYGDHARSGPACRVGGLCP
jgi:TetR/AcrR family transcriptional regulator, transcriptional repressor for nem operon